MRKTLLTTAFLLGAALPLAAAGKADSLSLTVKGKKSGPYKIDRGGARFDPGSGTFTAFLVLNCPKAPADPCALMPDGWPNIDRSQLSTACPAWKVVNVRFTQPGAKAPAVKPGKYGNKSTPVGVWTEVTEEVASNGVQIYAPDAVDVTRSTPTEIAGTLHAKNAPGDSAFDGTFTAKVCQ